AARVLHALAPDRVAHDVVVEDTVDRELLRLRALGVQLGPDEALLFAREADEDEGGVEAEAALGDDARELHGEGGAAAVVVDAGGEVVADRPVEPAAGALGGRAGRGGGRGRRASGTGHGVVVAAHIEAPRRPSGEHGHDAAHLDLARDAVALLRDAIGV